MKFKDAMRKICDMRGFTFQELSEEVGSSSAAVSNMVYKGNPSIAVCNKYLRPMSYSVAFVPDGARLPDGCFIVNGKDVAGEAE